MSESKQEAGPSTAKRSMRWVYVLGVLGFFAYAFWMIGPYLRSVIVRDAAVTSWTNLNTAFGKAAPGGSRLGPFRARLSC